MSIPDKSGRRDRIPDTGLSGVLPTGYPTYPDRFTTLLSSLLKRLPRWRPPAVLLLEPFQTGDLDPSASRLASRSSTSEGLGGRVCHALLARTVCVIFTSNLPGSVRYVHGAHTRGQSIPRWCSTDPHDPSPCQKLRLRVPPALHHVWADPRRLGQRSRQAA